MPTRRLAIALEFASFRSFRHLDKWLPLSIDRLLRRLKRAHNPLKPVKRSTNEVGRFELEQTDYTDRRGIFKRCLQLEILTPSKDMEQILVRLPMAYAVGCSFLTRADPSMYHARAISSGLVSPVLGRPPEPTKRIIQIHEKADEQT